MRIEDLALATSARRLVESTLALGAGARLLVLHDRAHADIAQSIADSMQTLGGKAALCDVETLGARPHARLPGDVRKLLSEVEASVLLVDFVREEARMRAELVEATSSLGLKHAHMVGVSRDALLAGLSTEPSRIALLARALLRRLGPTSKIHARSRAGTDLVVRCAPGRPWIEASGTIKNGEYANVPSGELTCHPGEVDGVYVADGTLGEGEGRLGGRLDGAPLVIKFERGRVVSVESSDTVRAVRVRQRLSEVRELDRVGLAFFGTNLGLGEPTGEIIVDQKAPGLHLSLGHTMRARTQATWDVPAWISFTARGLDVDVDGAPVLRGGRYLFTA